MPPELFQLLDQTPRDQRRGPVFRPLGDEGNLVGTYYAGHVISNIGEAAGVIVLWHQDGKVLWHQDGKPKKFASAHDLRRSFGEWWAKHLPLNKLQELMRHESIDTTMRYYVGRNAEDTAKDLWAVHNLQHDLQHDPQNATPKNRRNPLPRNK